MQTKISGPPYMKTHMFPGQIFSIYDIPIIPCEWLEKSLWDFRLPRCCNLDHCSSGCCLVSWCCSPHCRTTYQSYLQGWAVQEEYWECVCARARAGVCVSACACVCVWMLEHTGTVWAVNVWQEQTVAEQQGWWGAENGQWSHVQLMMAQWKSHQGMGEEGRLVRERRLMRIMVVTIKQSPG